MTTILDTSIPALPWGMGFTAIAGMAVIFLLGFIKIRRGMVPRASTFVWSGIFVVLLLFIAIMCFCELCIVEFWIYLIYVGVMTLFGSVTIFREGILRKLLTARTRRRYDANEQFKAICPNVSYLRNTIRVVLFIAIASFAAMVALEIADNDQLFMMWPETFWYAYLLCAFIVAGLYFLCQRHGGGPAVGIALFCVIGIAENFVDRFKEATITPNDLFALGTAMEVGAGYRYELNTSIFISIMAAGAGIFFCAFLASTGRRSKRPLVQIGINIVAGVLALTGFGLSISVPNHAEVFNVHPFYWDLRKTYRTKGFLLSFATLVQQIDTQPPDGYTSDEAEEIERELVARYDETIGSSEALSKTRAQYEQIKPNVVTIMNETYSDLSIYDGMHAGYTGPSYTTDNPADALERGKAYVSTFGGGTCNSEFEYLTGASLGYLGGGRYPYVQYNLTDVDCLPGIMKRLGYDSVAIHPASPNNWNRNMVYATMGFDEFISMDAFNDAPRYHHDSTVTDGATYDKVLEVLAGDDDPQFIMDITIQNHGGYDTGNIPEEDRLHYTPDVLDQDSADQLNEFLACIEASDRDLARFIDEMREFDEPTAVVFFGDHQPNISSVYNDELYPDEDSMIHYDRLYQTVYFIWANYEIEGFDENAAEIAGIDAKSLPDDVTIETRAVTVDGETLATVTVNRDISLNFLAAYALQTIGAPLTDYQKCEIILMQEMPVVCVNGYRDTLGNWYAHDDTSSPIRGVYDDLGMIQYLNFNERLR